MPSVTASPARPASSAATPTAPAPSTTSLARSSRKTIASATSSSETTTSPSTHSRMSPSVSVPGRLTAMPSAMVSAEVTATGSPAASEVGKRRARLDLHPDHLHLGTLGLQRDARPR